MSIIDSMIRAVSPGRAAERAEARARLEALDLRAKIQAPLRRGYTGAAGGRRVENWLAPRAQNPNSIIAKSSLTLRDRTHDLARNNSYAQLIVTRHADNIVGTGISPKALCADKVLAKKIDKLFKKFSKRIDPQGILNFYGLQYQAVRGMVEGGEVFARRRARRASDGLAVSLQIQLMESEFVDSGVTASKRSNNTVIDGIEFDQIGGRFGYWMFSQHPASPGFTGYTAGQSASKLVPAEDVIHLYEPQRTQVRGVPWLATIIQDLRDLDDYSSAEMVRKKTEACMVGIMTPGDDDPEGDDPNIGLERRMEMGGPGDIAGDADHTDIDPDFEDRPGIYDSDGQIVERFEPGMFAILRGGKDIKFNNPSVSAGHEAWVRTQLRRISSGARMPYEVMTGDLSLVNFASGKMGMLQYQQFVEAMQWNIVVPMFCDPIWDWFIEAIRLAGEIPVDAEVDVEWTVPRFKSINPKDDAAADQIEVRNGFMSWDEAVAKRGFEPNAVATAIVARNKFWSDNGVVLDCDPRFVSAAGQKHQEEAEPADAEPDEEEADDAAGK